MSNSVQTKLDELTTRAKELKVWNLSRKVLEDPRFYESSGSGSPEKHHYGKHGLLIHTHEVVELCFLNAGFISNEINQTVLFMGALYHDYGKCWDYERVECESPYYQKTLHAKNIHHVSRSAIEWGKVIGSCPAHSYLEEPVYHMILSHRGRKEYGSPVSPNSSEAWLLHLCDSISARLNEHATR